MLEGPSPNGPKAVAEEGGYSSGGSNSSGESRSKTAQQGASTAPRSGDDAGPEEEDSSGPLSSESLQQQKEGFSVDEGGSAFSPQPFGCSEREQRDSGGKTCINCRKSKVRCDKGEPCERCVRLQLNCVAQTRGRGRPLSRRRPGEGSDEGPQGMGGYGGFVGGDSSSGGGGKGVGGMGRRKGSIGASQGGEDGHFVEYHHLQEQLAPFPLKRPRPFVEGPMGGKPPQPPLSFPPHHRSHPGFPRGASTHPSVHAGQPNWEREAYQQARPPHSGYPYPSFVPSPMATHVNSAERTWGDGQGGAASDAQSNRASRSSPGVSPRRPVSGAAAAAAARGQRDAASGDGGTLTWHDVNELVPPVSLMNTILGTFWRLNELNEISRVKAQAVIRHWLLLALDRGSTNLLRKALTMAQALDITPERVIDTPDTFQRFYALVYASESTVVPPRPPMAHVPVSEVPEFISVLGAGGVAAVSTRIVVKGENVFSHNKRFSDIFLSSREANEMYMENKRDVWATVIHHSDHNLFFNSLASALFKVPTPTSGCSHVLRVVDRRGCSFLALVYFRAFFKDAGEFACFGLSVQPLPASPHLVKVGERPVGTVSANLGGTDGGGSDSTSPTVQGSPVAEKTSERRGGAAAEGGAKVEKAPDTTAVPAGGETLSPPLSGGESSTPPPSVPGNVSGGGAGAGGSRVKNYSGFTFEGAMGGAES